MDTHFRGPVGSLNDGAAITNRAFHLVAADATEEQTLECLILASESDPVFVQIDGFVDTVFNGTGTDTLTVGNETTADAYVASGVIVPSTLGFQSGETVMLTTQEKLTVTLGPSVGVKATGTLTSDATAPSDGTAATGTFTPPTTGTATCVINGVSFLATFNASATQTVTDLKALIAANAPTTALVQTGGTTTLTLTAKTVYASGNAITTTSNEANGASFAAATLTGGDDPDSVVIGDTTYYAKTALTASPTTLPNEVLIGGTAAAFLDNLKLAINAGAGIGTNYSTGTTANESVIATTNTDTTQVVEAIVAGVEGNDITFTEDSTHLSVGAGMAGGVSPASEGSMYLLVKVYGVGRGVGLNS
jgi:hypothetical protein